MLIIMRFGENNVLGPTYIDKYQFWGFVGGGGYMVHLTFFSSIHKNGKSKRAWPILKFNSTSFWFLKNILGWIITIYLKGPAAIPSWSEYSNSNWFHSNTPNLRHIFNANC